MSADTINREEEAQSQIEQQTRLFFESGMFGALYWVNDGWITEANDKFLEIVGYTREDLATGRLNWMQITPPEFHEVDEKHLAELRSKGVITPFEKEYIRKDGSRIPVIVGGARLLDEQRGVAFVIDNSDRKRAEAAQQAFQTLFERLQATFNNAASGIVEVDNEDRLVAVNDRICEMLGYRREELIGMRVYDLVRPEDRAQSYEMSAKVREGRETVFRYEKRYLKRDGSLLWAEVGLSPVHDKNGRYLYAVGTVLDISARKAVEAELRLHAAVLEVSPSAISVSKTDRDGTIEWVNPAFTKLTGYSPEEVIGRSHNILSSGIQEEAFYSNLWETIEQGKIWHGELVNRRKDGTLYHEEMGIAPLRDEEGNIRNYIAVKQDITARKEAEQALRDSEIRYRALVAASSEVLYRMSPDWKEMQRLHSDDFLANTEKPSRDWMESYIPPEDHALVKSAIEKAIHTRSLFELEHRVRRRDGSVGWTFSRAVPIMDKNGEIVEWFGAASDITQSKRAEKERKELEARAHNISRLESIGRLAGGIAHDFNNLLSGIFGYLEVSRYFAENGEIDKVKTTLGNALGVFNRAKNLTQQLLTFAKGGGPTVATEDISKCVREAVAFALSGSNVETRLDLPEHLWQCKIDRNQVSQALNNILVNAKEAMPRGGTISVKVANLSAITKVPGPLSPGNYVQISIADEGHGIPGDVIEHVFDPFFTTKESGHGLGLSIAYSIIKKHGGITEISSKPGMGTTVNVFLPASPESAAIPVSERAAPARKFVCGRILVMDDDEVLQDVIKVMLEGLGYSVTTAKNGEEAIDLYRKALKIAKPFDVTILDLTVKGGLGGLDTISRLLGIDPRVRAIVSSGYSNDPVMAYPQSNGFRGAITKPFQSRELDELLRNIMNEPHSVRLKVV